MHYFCVQAAEVRVADVHMPNKKLVAPSRFMAFRAWTFLLLVQGMSTHRVLLHDGGRCKCMS